MKVNLEAALNEEPRAGADRKLTSNEEALLVATACSSPPEGRARWTLELLAGAMVKLTDHDSLSRETVRRRLAENHLKPWQKDMWCIPKVDAEYVARMEDVLDLYAEQPDPKRPVVCFDESPTQLIGEARQPIPAAPGRPERFDYEYRRNGAVNLFVFLDAHRSWRRVKVTDRRTADDFALCMRELVDVDFPEAERIRVVLDNLSTHTAAALYAAFPPAEARRVLRRLEFHYTPKHASWLNMVEIEIGVLKGQCLDRRIESCDRLVAEIDVWQSQRNQSGARNQLDVLHRQGQNQNGARLSRSLAQRVIITVQGNSARDSLNDQRIDGSLPVQGSHGCVDCAVEGVGISEGLMGQMARLEIVPDNLDVVEFGCVFWQPLDGEPVFARLDGFKSELADMDRPVVLDQYDRFYCPSWVRTEQVVELLEVSDEVAAALGLARMHTQLARDMIE